MEETNVEHNNKALDMDEVVLAVAIDVQHLPASQGGVIESAKIRAFKNVPAVNRFGKGVCN